MCMGGGHVATVHMWSEVRGQPVGVTSLSTVWVLGIERSLTASVLPDLNYPYLLSIYYVPDSVLALSTCRHLGFYGGFLIKAFLWLSFYRRETRAPPIAICPVSWHNNQEPRASPPSHRPLCLSSWKHQFPDSERAASTRVKHCPA